MSKSSAYNKAQGEASTVKSFFGWFAVVTLIALSSGFGLAWVAASRLSSGPQKTGECSAAEPKIGKAPDSVFVVKSLPALLTKLTGDKAPWVRVELSVLIQKDAPEMDRLTASINNDIIAYIRTLSAGDLSGPTNFELLRSDLQEIARRRSQGKAHEVYVRTLLLE